MNAPARLHDLRPGRLREQTLVPIRLLPDISTVLVGRGFEQQAVYLPPVQFRLLRFLIEHPGRLFVAHELAELVWGTVDVDNPGSVARNAAHDLRETLRAAGVDPSELIRSRVAAGYYSPIRGLFDSED